MYVCYMGLKSNSCFVTGAALKGNHYWTYIISGVGHLRSDSVMPLMLWMIAYNIWGTMLYYKSLGTVLTLLIMGNNSGRPYC
jgi:hypothetical protein